MTTLLESMFSFAATGRIGPLRLGMPSSEADRLLGLAGPTSSPFKDGSLELWVGPDRTVRLLGFDSVDGCFSPPSWLGAAAGAQVEGLSRTAVLDGLGRLGCAWRHDEALTFDDQAAVLTESGVSAVFTRRQSAADGWVLYSLYASVGS
ncbi:hypothetical protein ABZW30_43275 [Kitasatospora sp. NPDC004669]|uniref:hypothetical protein n=1 Tax=Kitasatospora sp. NPDC004669 TaxID=3154555 RepID=UPI0033B21F22